MRVTLFGASGKVGSIVLRNLLDHGYEVVAFTHNKPIDQASKQTIISKGDVHNLNDVSRAVKGSDAIISTLGSWGTKTKDIVSVATENIIISAHENQIKRVLTLTGSDAYATGDKLSAIDKLTHSLIKLSPARKILNDGNRHIQLLEKSNLNWTVFRSPVMNNRGDSGNFTLTTNKPKGWETINRHSVVRAIVDHIDDKELYKKAVFIRRS